MDGLGIKIDIFYGETKYMSIKDKLKPIVAWSNDHYL